MGEYDDFVVGLIIGLIAGIPIGVGLCWFAAQSLFGSQSSQGPVASQESHAPVNTYQNLEEWELIRDSSGRLVGAKIHRKASEQNDLTEAEETVSREED